MSNPTGDFNSNPHGGDYNHNQQNGHNPNYQSYGDNRARRAGYGQSMNGQFGLERPQNYLVFNILATALCCVPAGVVGIIYASKVDNLWNSGRYQEAEQAANNAKIWMLVSVGAGLFLGFILFIIALVS